MTKAQIKNPDRRMRGDREEATESDISKDLSIFEERSRVHLAIAVRPHTWRRELYRSSLPASALRVGLALVDRYLNRKHGRCDPSHETLAEECGMSVRTVRDGLAALRASGLISTRKQGLQGTLFFYFAIPSNAAEIQQVVDEVQCGEDPSLNPADFRRATDGFPASNLRGTSERELSNDRISCGPPSPFADAQFDPGHSDPDLTATANVEGDGRRLRDVGEVDPHRMPRIARATERHCPRH